MDVAIDSITVAYGNTMPVENLSLNVAQGEFLSLLGPSGCGKTTTLRSVAGFIRPGRGEIRVGGKSVNGVPPNKRNMGMVYQDYALFPHMTIAQNVAFGMKMRGASKSDIAARVQEMLALLQLSGMGGRYPSQLSGGQQQRIALARALVINPAVLLLDEPMAALDKQLRADMQFELRALQRRFGITTIFVTHDQEEALSLSDRIAVMQGGRILQVDSPKAVYDFPSTRFVAEFIGTANLFPGEVIGLDGDRTVVRLEGVPELQRVRGQHRNGPIELMLRPERLQLVPAVSDTRNTLSGRVRNAVFVGNAVKYQIDGPSGVLRVDAPAIDAHAATSGDQVHLAWAEGDARVFRDGILER
jgi:putative spermidine/putrescine transport system ATP-binding protein